MAVSFWGIRHHGPGSARNVVEALDKLCPDMILLEGPPEAVDVFNYVKSLQMEPPVALLAYESNNPKNAVFYPFAEFSPEWQVMLFALKNNVELRFFDLPLVNLMAYKTGELDVCVDGSKREVVDPFDFFAKVDNLPDGETWWNTKIEQRKDNFGIFEAVDMAVSELRSQLEINTLRRDKLREAAMRCNIRESLKNGYNNVAVVCGAWHIPALKCYQNITAAYDKNLLKKLPKIKISCTWIPWTYNRLSLASGYGAGIVSPGWYSHLWHYPFDDGSVWVSRIAALLREKNIDVSPAHVVDTVLLANSLAGLRGLVRPSLNEFSEAVTSVIGGGENILMKIIEKELIVGERIGTVPDNVPKVALLCDIEQTAKKLRVPFSSEPKDYNLDLRNPLHLGRSIFFRRLRIMDIDWAMEKDVSGCGTFKELWHTIHQPENIVKIIENATWGNTLLEATENIAVFKIQKLCEITDVSRLLKQVIPADLPLVAEKLTKKLDSLSASTSDIVEMMKVIPDLSEIVKYGDVRKLDFSHVKQVLSLVLARIMSGGINACCNINDEVAGKMLNLFSSADFAVSALNYSELGDMWLGFLKQVYRGINVHQLLAGFSARLLYNKGIVDAHEIETEIFFHGSQANDAVQKAFWFEGFLQRSSAVLLIDNCFWNIINSWLKSLDNKQFMDLLPILRRTFSQYSPAERRRLGQKAKEYNLQIEENDDDIANVDAEDALKVLPLIERLLG